VIFRQDAGSTVAGVRLLNPARERLGAAARLGKGRAEAGGVRKIHVQASNKETEMY
jgi:hypothetical protein